MLYIGQKVVAKKDHEQGLLKKGKVYTIEATKLPCCEKSGNLFVMLKEVETNRNAYCPKVIGGCGTTHRPGWFSDMYFEPVVDTSFGEEITERIEREIAEPVEEMLVEKESIQ